MRKAALSLSLGLLVAGVAVRWLLAWGDLGRVLYGFCNRMDDCFYYFQIARSVAAGGPVAPDGVLVTNGFHPLWLLLLVPLYKAAPADPVLAVHLALSLCVLLWLGSGVLWFLIARGLGFSTTVSLAVLALYSISLHSLLWSLNGLETSLALLLFAAFLYAVLRLSELPRPSPRWIVVTGVLTGLLALARTDYWVTILVVFVYQLVRARRTPGAARGWLAALGLGVLIFLPWPVWSWLKLGSPVPVSAVAYPYYRHANWLAASNGLSWRRLVLAEVDKALDLLGDLARYSSLGRAGLSVALAGVMAAVSQHPKSETSDPRRMITRGLLSSASVGVLCQTGLSALVRWIASDWYFAPMILVLWLWLLFPAAALCRGGRATVPLLFLLFALGGAFAWEDAQQYQVAVGSSGFQQVVSDQYRAIPDPIVGVSDSGWAGYFAPQRVVNLDGKVNNAVFAAIKSGRFVAYLRALGIRYATVNALVMAVVRRTDPQCGFLRETAPGVYRLPEEGGTGQALTPRADFVAHTRRFRPPTPARGN